VPFRCLDRACKSSKAFRHIIACPIFAPREAYLGVPESRVSGAIIQDPRQIEI